MNILICSLGLLLSLPARAGDSIAISMSEDSFQGDAVAQVSVDGLVVGMPTVVTAHGKGSQDYVVGANLAPGAHTITVTFTNDSYGYAPDKDRNLYVDGIFVNRVSVGAPAPLFSTGSSTQATFTVNAGTVASTSPVTPAVPVVNTPAVPPTVPNVTPVVPTVTPIGYRVGYTAHDTAAPAILSSVEGWLGRKLDMSAATLNMNAWWWGNIPKSYAVNVSFPMLSISGWDSLGANDMAMAAAGGYDRYYVAMAKALAAAGNQMVVRPGWEMNGNWYPWSVNGAGGKNQSFANYVATFRRIAGILRQYVPGVKIEFCTNPQFQPYSVGGGGPPDYWPGADVVDVITMDVYQTNTGDWTKTLTGGQFNLNWLTSFAQQQNVKIGMSEWGAAGGDAAWMTSAIAWMNALGDRFVFSVYSSWDPADQLVKAGVQSGEQAAWIKAWGKTVYQPTSKF